MPVLNEIPIDDPRGMYEALLSGAFQSSRISVSYSLLQDGRTGIRMQFARPGGGNVIIVEVSMDLLSSRGIRVDIDGEKSEVMEEAVRRGGLVNLPYRIRQQLLVV